MGEESRTTRMTVVRFLIGIGVAMLVAGIILGLAYPLYCTQFSGKQVGKFPVSFSIDLDPQMNPVIFNWQARVSGSGTVVGNRESNGYKASLYLGKQPLMVETFSISHDEKEKTGTAWKGNSIGSFDVPQAGQYHFVLEELAKPRITVSGMQIEVRRNVIVPSTPVVFTGYALIVAGILFTIVMLSFSHSTLSAAGRRELASRSSYKPRFDVLIDDRVGALIVGFMLVCGLIVFFFWF